MHVLNNLYMFENNPTEILYPNLNKMHDDQRTTEQWRKKTYKKKVYRSNSLNNQKQTNKIVKFNVYKISILGYT